MDDAKMFVAKLKLTGKWLLKALLAAVLAVAILSAFCFFYYNYGVRKTNLTGATDYSWENAFFCHMEEGIGFGVYDEDGFNNGNYPGGQIDVLLMGSSHINAYNVKYDQGLAWILNTKEWDKTVYNIGMEGHDLARQAYNLPYALDYYEPNEYVVLEMFQIPSEEEMQSVLDGTWERSSAYDAGVIYYLQKIPFFRILHKKIADYRGSVTPVNTISTNAMEETESQESVQEETSMEKTRDAFLSNISRICEEKKVKPILLYHTVPLRTEKTWVFQSDADTISSWRDTCEEEGILFLDATKAFEDRYMKNYHIPYGFSNTKIGWGHLNADGHQILAELLYEALR